MAVPAPDPRTNGRGAVLLLEHCAAIERLDDGRPHAYTRLEEAVGDRLARLLVGALVADQPRSSREPVG